MRLVFQKDSSYSRRENIQKKKRNERAVKQIRVTSVHMVLGMKDHSIIIKVRQGEFTQPYSLLINVSHVYYVSPDSSKKIKDVLAEFNEGGSLKQYDPHEVRTFPFQDFLKPCVPAFPYSPLISLAQLEKLASQHFFLLNFK